MRTYKASCHPRKTKKSKTCYEDSDLIYLRDEWNRQNPSKQIKSSQNSIIYKKLRGYLENCTNELCWLKIVHDNDAKQKIIKKNFATFHPKNWRLNEKEWLSNFDITRVLKQYAEFHPEFTFIDPSPIDFDTKIGEKCVTEKLCKLNVNDYITKGITKMAIPLNLDKHTGNGFHWVTLFIDLKRKFIYYFDSANNKIPPEVRSLIDRIKEQIQVRELNNQSVQHQRGGTECGMYVLFFIISMIEGKSPTYFNKRIITDEEVFKFRKIYFNSDE
jgi:hypothetical protein